MAEKEVILSPEGMKSLEEELDHLKTVKRREVADRIRQARAFGDITENSEYEDAKNTQAFVEGRIITLEKLLRNARVIDDNEIATDRVTVGCRVTLRDKSSEEFQEYLIVGSTEADPARQKISNESPVGKALLGRRVGDSIQVRAPAGIMEFEIIAIGQR
ncbi:MAG: transcription elongation factor GreA [Bacillota bacterium]